MSLKIKLAIAAFVVAIGAVIAVSSMEATRVSYRVCMSIDGRSHCAVAEGHSEKVAIQSAMEIDCGLIAASRSQLMVCEGSQPASVEKVEK
jgi:hypothetical protein